MSVSETEPIAGRPAKRIEGRSLSERVRLYVLEQSGGVVGAHKATGVPKTTLGPWLKGEKGLTSPVFDRICEAYRINATRSDVGLGDSEHVPYVRNIITKNASLADYEQEVIRLRYRERELLDQLSQLSSIIVTMKKLAAAATTHFDLNENTNTGGLNEVEE